METPFLAGTDTEFTEDILEISKSKISRCISHAASQKMPTASLPRKKVS